jgi:hypothetical protein
LRDNLQRQAVCLGNHIKIPSSFSRLTKRGTQAFGHSKGPETASDDQRARDGMGVCPANPNAGHRIKNPRVMTGSVITVAKGDIRHG